MPLDPGTKLGPYEIQEPLGAGGMGEVYKARDTRLERTVAVKILPKHLSVNEGLKQRFDREAKVISNLSHPNICPLFDVGNANGVDYLVMEYLEGETLFARLAKGALSPQETLQLGMQIADALQAAHRAGVVHRDLKPGNIMLTRTGVKLLDFGLAKAGAGADAADSVTAMHTAGGSGEPLTQEGSILGTFQYMAPEQLEGKEADARTDIFSMGAVLYEMATGTKAFEGESQASLISKIMSADPQPIAELVPMTPPALDRVVRTCLAKDPDRRFQSAHDLRLQLEWILEGGSQAGLPAPVVAKRRRREHLWMGAAAVLFLATIAFGYLSLGTRSPSKPRPMKFSLLHTAMTGSPQFILPALSPDGARMAYVGFNEQHRTVIYLRDLSGLDAQALPGTESGTGPFWSPDGQHIGFFADGKLKKVDITGGPPQVLCEAEGGARGGAWNDRGDILFATSWEGQPIWRVSDEGGDRTAATGVDSTEEGHLWPSFLPDGEHFIFLGDASSAENHHLRVGSLDGTVSKKLSNEISNFQFVPPDYVLFGKSGVLVAQKIDLDALDLVGDPVALERDVVPLWGHDYQFTASDNGLLAYRNASPLMQQTWFDRAGRTTGLVGDRMWMGSASLSPDGTRLAVTKMDVEGRAEDILILDVQRNITSRFTLDPGSDTRPVWSPDGTRILFQSSRTGVWQCYIKSTRGAGEETLRSDLAGDPLDWSPDGTSLLAFVDNPDGDIAILDMNEPDNMRIVVPTRTGASDARFSPDGAWFAYDSDESGREEIYVQSVRGKDRVQISTEGGSLPRWRGDGRELYYAAPGGFIMAVGISYEPYLELSAPRALFVVPAGFRMFDVTGDGERFIVSVSVDGILSKPLTMVLNWTEELEK